MSTYTPNYNLEKPEPTDPFGYNSFLPLFNDNMDIIDQNLGGGGSSGHTIVDEDGTILADEPKLQFTDGLSASDDSINGKTIIKLDYFAVVGGELCQVRDDGN